MDRRDVERLVDEQMAQSAALNATREATPSVTPAPGVAPSTGDLLTRQWLMGVRRGWLQEAR